MPENIETNRDLVRNLIEDLNRGRLDLLDDVVAGDYQQDNASVAAGRPGLKILFGNLRTAFPDLVVTIDDLVAEGNQVVALTRLRGTHRGDLPGVAATGKTVDVSSMDLYRIDGGRIVEHFGRFDELGMLRQLGVAQEMSWRQPTSAGS